ncbi:MAG: putative ABC transporter permease subunit [Anaerolineae bacterium]
MNATIVSSPAVLPAVWKLLRLRVRLSINTFRHARLRIKILRIVGTLGLLAFAGLAFWGSTLMLRVLSSPEFAGVAQIDLRTMLQTMPVWILTGLFLGVLFTSFGVLLQALYLAGDMDFLLSSPVPIRAVFVTKLLQAVLPNFGLFALFGLPVLYGLGITNGYQLAYYPLVVLMMAALTLSAAALAALLVMTVVRILPPRRAAEILGFIGATAGVLCSQIGNLSQTFGRHANLSPTLLSAVLPWALRLKSLWIPLSWAGVGLVDIGEGRLTSGLGLLVSTLALAAGIFWVALVTAERLYYSGWAGMQVVAQKKKAPPRPRPSAVSGLPGLLRTTRLLPAPVAGILAKDFTLMGRDLRNLSQLISPIIVGVVLTFSLLRGGDEIPSGRGQAPTWFMDSLRALFLFGNVGVSLFVGWIMLWRLAGMSFSQEGHNYWMLKVSPVTAGQLLYAKFLGAYLPALGAGTLFLLGTSLLRSVPLGQLLFMVCMLAFCLAGLNGLLIAFGVAGANFKWDDPRRMNAGVLGCIGQILTLVFLPLSLGLFIGPWIALTAMHFPSVYAYGVGAVLGIAINLLLAWLPPRLVKSRVQRLDEA